MTKAPLQHTIQYCIVGASHTVESRTSFVYAVWVVFRIILKYFSQKLNILTIPKCLPRFSGGYFNNIIIHILNQVSITT